MSEIAKKEAMTPNRSHDKPKSVLSKDSRANGRGGLLVRISSSPLLSVMLAILSVFIVEIFVMFSIEKHREFPELLKHALIDSTVLVLILFPILYLLLHHPLSRQIEQRKQAEEELQVERNRLRSIMEAMTDCLTVRDLDYNITYESPSAVNFFGNHIGEKCYKVYESKDEICDGCPVEMAYTDGEVHVAERTVTMPSGEISFWENTACPIQDADGQIVSCLEIAKNITERKRVENKMQLQARLVAEMSDGVNLVRVSDGKIVYANSVFEKMLGYEPSELLGKHISTINNPADKNPAETANEIMAALKKSGEWHGEVSNITKEGSPIDCRVSIATFVHNEHGEVAVTVQTDITEHKKAESELRESESRFRRAIEDAPFPIMIHADDGEVIQLSNVWTEITGYARHEIPTVRDWADRAYGERAEVIQEYIDSLYLLDKRREEGEYVITTKGGCQVVWDFVSSPLGKLPDGRAVLMTMAMDVTERKKAEEQVKELAKFPAENPSPVLRVSANGILRHANKASSCLLSEWKTEIGQVLPDKIASVVSAACVSVESQALVVSCRDRLYSFIVAPVQGTDYANLYGRDITEHRQMEEQLRQSEKMQAIGELAGGIAHDFNNQLTAVLGYADMLENRLKDEKLSKYATNIKKGARRAAELTKQLLAFSRKGKNLSVPVEMHKVLLEVIAILEHSIDKRIKIHQSLNARPAIAIGDPNQLQNAILNIALNARDAMDKAGELIFETDVVELDNDFCKEHPYEILPGTYLKISVTDNGCGMDDETQKHIFEPFYTTKGVGEGTGMGLASVYGTIRNHQGAISVHSDVGDGTTFNIYLPLGEDIRGKQEANRQSTPITGTARILLVDDEEMVRELAADMLRGIGYEVTVCKDGKEAVECYEKSWRETDLVILDMVMPEIGGLDTFIIMRGINPKIRSLLSSGYSHANEVQEVLDEGVMGFVQKPYDQVELSERVAQVFGGDRLQ